MTYEQFEVVRVPFPFADRNVVKNRPAVVLSNGARFNSRIDHSVMAMITTAAHTPWPLDHEIADLRSAGLSTASVVRFKLFTLDHRLVRGTVGVLAPNDAEKVTRTLRALFRIRPSKG